MAKKGHRAWNKGLQLPRKPLAERFWPKVDRRGPDECWLWLGARTYFGHGRIYVGGGRADRVLAAAHRVAWELANGKPAPRHLAVCHSCDNPPCCNPAHLWLGTAGDNVRDARAKNRLFPAYRTHCKYGHEYTPENTRLYRGHRRCITCANNNNAHFRAIAKNKPLRLLVAFL